MIKYRNLWDRLGIALSVVCLLLPVAIAMAPFVAARWLEAEEFHVAAALALISTAAFAGERLLSQEWTTGLTVAGGLILVTAHAVNLVLRRACPACGAGAYDAPR